MDNTKKAVGLQPFEVIVHSTQGTIVDNKDKIRQTPCSHGP